MESGSETTEASPSGSKTSQSKWSVDMREYLIELVKPRERLWKKESGATQEKRTTLWEHISHEIEAKFNCKVDMDEMKKTWKNLKDNYMRMIRYKESFPDKNQKWHYFGLLTFLDRANVIECDASPNTLLVKNLKPRLHHDQKVNGNLVMFGSQLVQVGYPELDQFVKTKQKTTPQLYRLKYEISNRTPPKMASTIKRQRYEGKLPEPPIRPHTTPQPNQSTTSSEPNISANLTPPNMVSTKQRHESKQPEPPIRRQPNKSSTPSESNSSGSSNVLQQLIVDEVDKRSERSTSVRSDHAENKKGDAPKAAKNTAESPASNAPDELFTVAGFTHLDLIPKLHRIRELYRTKAIKCFLENMTEGLLQDLNQAYDDYVYHKMPYSPLIEKVLKFVSPDADRVIRNTFEIFERHKAELKMEVPSSRWAEIDAENNSSTLAEVWIKDQKRGKAAPRGPRAVHRTPAQLLSRITAMGQTLDQMQIRIEKMQKNMQEETDASVKADYRRQLTAMRAKYNERSQYRDGLLEFRAVQVSYEQEQKNETSTINAKRPRMDDNDQQTHDEEPVFCDINDDKKDVQTLFANEPESGGWSSTEHTPSPLGQCDSRNSASNQHFDVTQYLASLGEQNYEDSTEATE